MRESVDGHPRTYTVSMTRCTGSLCMCAASGTAHRKMAQGWEPALSRGPMIDPWLQQLVAWHNFYLLLGSAAATLTGLMFVVLAWLLGAGLSWLIRT